MCRATLRPMSKNRRDSSVSELEQRLRDVKSNNCRFRKALMEKEAELQVISFSSKLFGGFWSIYYIIFVYTLKGLIRKLGPESRNWIDGSNCDSEPLLGQTKLSVPQIRRDLHSTTEITEMTSVGSVTSTHCEDNGTINIENKRWCIYCLYKFYFN